VQPKTKHIHAHTPQHLKTAVAAAVATATATITTTTATTTNFSFCFTAPVYWNYSRLCQVSQKQEQVLFANHIDFPMPNQQHKRRKAWHWKNSCETN